jgi:hypothetical protein
MLNQVEGADKHLQSMKRALIEKFADVSFRIFNF